MPEALHTEIVKPQCGALTKSGKPCTVSPMPNGRCHKHGGATPSGVASASFKHGRFSKHLPERLAAEYAAARRDPELLAVREDIALLSARQCDLLGRVDTGESGEAWRSLLGAVREAQRCRRSLSKAAEAADFGAMREAAEELSGLLAGAQALAAAGASDYAAWDEVKALSEQLRKLRESEAKRLVAMQQMVTQDAAAAMMGKVLLILRTYVRDPETLRSISADLRRVVACTASG